jgi:flagellin
MSVINTNVSSSIAQSALAKNERALGKAMEQLSTGKRINSASDDAAGLAISSRMTSQIKGLGQAIQNANDGINMINTAEGAMVEMTNMLQRMRELALQVANGSLSTADRSYLNDEYQALADELNRIGTKTEWNGNTILDDTADGGSSSVVTFQVGANSADTITVDFGDFTEASGAFTKFASSGSAVTISASTAGSGATLSTVAIGAIDTAITTVNAKRSDLGAVANRLEFAVDNLSNVKTNVEASRSRIEDTDYAAATTELARTQIIQQAATAMLAQANQLPQSVLALLK